MPEPTTSVRKSRILCTEDDADTREVLTLLLQLAGFDVTCVENSAHAIRLAQSEKFDLYLLDSWLPGMEGDDLCKTLRELDATIPVLFYSGATAPADRARAMAAGAKGYLLKPADSDQLASEIKRLIAERM
ncbi:MAG: response regulator [Pyrinomonadaceae bacterium]